MISLTKGIGAAMQDVPFLLLQTRHHTRAQHSSCCSLAGPAALLSTLQKQNFIICLNFNRFLEGPGWGFCFFCFFFLFWPSVHSMARPLSSTNIRGRGTRQARTQILMKEISPCKTKIIMSIYSMATILRNSH